MLKLTLKRKDLMSNLIKNPKKKNEVRLELKKVTVGLGEKKKNHI